MQDTGSGDTGTESGDGRARIAELSQEAYQLLRQNEIEAAEAKFQEILEHDETNNYALVGLGDAARKRRNCDAAVKYYHRCLETHPRNNYALFGLADCYKSMRQFKRAIEYWEEYLQLDDENVTVLTRVADAYRKTKNYERSRQLYDRVLELEADNAYALIGLGHLNYDFKRYQDALYYWERMRKISGEDVDIRVLTSIGNCHRKLKNFERGIPLFQEALDREPRNFYALFGMADCYRGLGESASSLYYWNKILERDPRNKVILTRAADAYRAMGDFREAREYYEGALNIEYDTYAVLGLALLNRMEGKLDQAVKALRQLVEHEPKNTRFYVELAHTYLDMQDERNAMLTLRQLFDRGLQDRHAADLYNRLKGPR